MTAPIGLVELGDLGSRQERDVCRDLTESIAHPDQASPSLVIGARWVCQEASVPATPARLRRRRQLRALGWSSSRMSQCACCPAELRGQGSGDNGQHRMRRRRRPASQPPSAKRGRHAVLRERAPGHHGVRCRSARPASADTAVSRSADKIRMLRWQPASARCPGCPGWSRRGAPTRQFQGPRLPPRL